MNDGLFLFLSLSISGSILALILLALKPLIKNRLSQTWQYYIWLIIILRLLLPFGPETSVVDEAAQHFQSIVSNSSVVVTQPEVGNEIEIGGTTTHPSNITVPESEQTSESNHLSAVTFVHWHKILDYAWLFWLGVGLVLFVHKVVSYRSFVRFVKVGTQKITDVRVLDIYHDVHIEARIKKALPLYLNAQISSPMLVGIFRPMVVIPPIEASEEEYRNIFRHELTHYRRVDFLYKWLVQIAACLHWFNPLMYIIGKQINKNCELSCDEAVIKGLGKEERMAYGNALIKSLEAQGNYSDFVVSITMSENATLVKERLDAIMNHKKQKKWMLVTAALLAIVLFVGGYSLGAYMIVQDSEDYMEELVFSDEGLPIMSAKSREVYEAYISPIQITGILRRNWSPEDISSLVSNGSDSLLVLFHALQPDAVDESNGNLPAAIVDDVLSASFPIPADKIREVCADKYNADTDTYEYSGGLGGGPAVAIVTGYKKDGKLLTIYYTWFTGDPSADAFRYAANDSGELVLQLNENQIKYLSNKVIPVASYEHAINSEEHSLYISTARELMKEAHTVFSWYFNEAPLEELWIPEDAPQIELNGSYYRKVVRFKSLQELQAATEAIFTKEFCKANFSELINVGKFQEIDGELYIGDQGGISEGGTTPPKEYIVRSVTKEQVVLTAIYEGPDINVENPSNVPLVDYSFDLVLQNSGESELRSDGISWKVASYYGYNEDGYQGDALPFIDGVQENGMNRKIWNNEGASESGGSENIPVNFVSQTITFPANEIGKTEYSDAIFDIDPFTVELLIPESWQLKTPDSEENIAWGLFSPIGIYQNNVLIGSIGYNTFEVYEDAGDNPRAIYHQIMSGSVTSWDVDYTPVFQTETTCTATCKVRHQVPKDGQAMAAAETKYNQGILSYDKELLVYIGIEINEGMITSKNLWAIAKSVKLTPKE